MKPERIISRAESFRILKNDLRRAALENHAAELKEAGVEKREEIFDKIERDIEKEIRRRWTHVQPHTLLY
ncbi:MAG TPA: hypothetical protein VNZ64_17265 [Candidatus Acidoferrum sp.]|jgi:hypothetical protein|nr:hypothetical protein [Candidatus Acidoferrum sp.]